jgi:hypothetical protein
MFKSFVAGWSSLAARRAHNPKVVGSNPAPATTLELLVGLITTSTTKFKASVKAFLFGRDIAVLEVGFVPIFYL